MILLLNDVNIIITCDVFCLKGVMLYDLVSCPITYDLCSRYQPKLSNNLSIDEAWVEDSQGCMPSSIKASCVLLHCLLLFGRFWRWQQVVFVYVVPE